MYQILQSGSFGAIIPLWYNEKMIDKTSIEQLKNRLDIVDVIGNYIELKKAGSSYKALCPFHDEDTPSFVVSPAKQIFHCFGCGKGGDAITFVMEYEKLSYPEAIEKLASMYNFSLTYTNTNNPAKNLFSALEAVNALYKKELAKNKEAMEYLHKRGVSEATIEKFELGYAPSGQIQIDYLKKHYIPIPEAIKAGILAQDGQRVYARMMDRITFPIYSPNGALIGFGGRTLGNHPAKYLNSPETQIFHKSKILYGYHIAKEAIFKKKRMIICEGYMDVVMLHQAGFNTAVATLGTALTPSHLPLISRSEAKVILAYDGDSAGIAAALKAAKLLSANEIDGGVVIFPKGLDPADMIAQNRIEDLNQLFNNPKEFIQFVLETIVHSYDITIAKQKQKALEDGVAYLKSLPSLIAEEYKHYLAALLNIPVAKIVLGPGKRGSAQTIEMKDAKELSIIKTMLLFPHLIDSILDIIDAGHFQYHQEEFIAASQQNLDHPKLRAILLDEDIIAFDEESLHQELLTFLIKHYEKKIQQIVRSNMEFKKKSFLIRRYKEYIRKLKNGEFVVEDTNTKV